jgi:uncharacterized membrane protein YhiD involved in acid resistance
VRVARGARSASSRRQIVAAILAAVAVLCLVDRVAYAQVGAPTAPPGALTEPAPANPATAMNELRDALVRLPLAALLGAALAMRPKRRGTPPRTPAVIHTQIILAIVGAAIMLIVGASLARAFGIVGAANLIRYRSKIEDPKDAGVMLCALAVGLASGVGLYALAAFSTAFIVGALAVIESFEPKSFKRFDVHVKVEKGAAALRPEVEKVMRRFRVVFDLRTASEDQLSYDAQVPFETEIERITDALLGVAPKGQIAVDWDEKKTKIT